MKYLYREDYFCEIDTEEKAYVLGLLMADGSIFGNRLTLQLSGEDGEMVERVKNLLCLSKKTLDLITYKNPKYQNAHKLTIVNRRIADSLKNLGVVERKSVLLKEPKDLDSSLVRHLIRGYFDGDGHLGWWYYKQSKKEEKGKGSLKANFEITSTKNFCLWLKSEFYNIGVNSFLIKNRGKSYSLRISGNQQIEKSLDFIYNNSNIHLNRKFQKYREFKNLRIVKKIRERDSNGRFTTIPTGD